MGKSSLIPRFQLEQRRDRSRLERERAAVGAGEGLQARKHARGLYMKEDGIFR